MSKLFIPHDGDLFEDLKYGRITPGMFTAYSMILKQCDYETGFWFGSVHELHKEFGGQIGRKTLERDLNRLYKTRHLRSFQTKGKTSDYFVGIHGYKIRFGERRGLMLEAHQTADVLKPIYYTESDFYKHGTLLTPLPS